MRYTRTIAAGLCAAAMLITPGAAGAAAGTADEQIRRLDIMLMVTSLRCRFGADNFQPQYQRFSSAHLGTLNGAARRMEGSLVTRYGAKGAKRALDDISVKMANQYGQGHPWLGCGQLKRIATDLAGSNDPAVLGQAAAELLAVQPVAAGRFAAR